MTSQPYAWSDIEAALHTITISDGGFSAAHRGIITMPDGNRVFVKIGIDELTKQWAKKEIETYRFLDSYHYSFIPRLLAHNTDETSFALEALTPDEGWNWANAWTEARLTKTLAAMDALADLKLEKADKSAFAESFISETADGWRPLADDRELQTILLRKLKAAGHEDITAELEFATMATQSAKFVFQRDALVHNDVRADNCAWNEDLQTVRLIDWNWVQYGDRRIDTNAMLVHVHKTGFDILEQHKKRLDADTLHWLAGFWLRSATRPMLEGSSERMALRDYQLESGVAALKLARRLA